MVEIVDLALSAFIDSVEVYTIHSLIQNKNCQATFIMFSFIWGSSTKTKKHYYYYYYLRKYWVT